LTYQINDPICPKKFEIKMKITTDCKVLGVSGCVIKVMNAVSPNNDGNNDTFFIENLDCYPDNKVEIFNRWGILVYEGEHYDNKSITFNGISNGRSVISKDEMLPAGTYFYILKYKENNGTAIDKSGYLYLNK
jgi:gliding motility-associated-like protein